LALTKRLGARLYTKEKMANALGDDERTAGHAQLKKIITILKKETQEV
jgi:hypothetical protein